MRRLRQQRASAALAAALAIAASPAVAGQPHAPTGPGGMPPPIRPAPGPAAPDTLPGEGHVAASHGGRWLVAGHPGPATDALAARAGAEAVAPDIGLYAAAEPRAVRLVALLRARGILGYAEPEVPLRRAARAADPLSPAQWWLPAFVPDDVAPPAPAGAALGIIEGGIDAAHPEFARGNVLMRGFGSPDTAHGTAVASVASAPADGAGIVGMWPGAPTTVYADGESCSGASAAVVAAGRDRVPVINMSYGVPVDCYSHYVATQYAVGRGTLPVASAGNSFQTGSPPERPAMDPHVLTVGALATDLTPASFSSSGPAVDLSAPGVQVPAAVPAFADDDGTPDGYRAVDGTSFSAPIVAAAAAWVRAARPELDAGQVFTIMRASARDVGVAGWDERTGFGALDLRAALAAPGPARDAAEPNDDIEWVDGRRLPRQRPLLRVRTVRVVRATLDYTEDPVDVTPVWLPPRSRLTVHAIPAPGGDVHLEVLGQRARTIAARVRPQALLAGSYRRGSRPEIATVRNTATSPRIVYVATYVPGNARASGASYRLILRRTPIAR